MITLLKGFHVERRLSTGNEADYVLLFANKNSQMIAAWTTAEQHDATVTVENVKDVRAMDATFDSCHLPTPTVDSGKLTMSLSESPIYINLYPVKASAKP
jgi:hypothetical protein